jgi:hypothetical protein
MAIQGNWSQIQHESRYMMIRHGPLLIAAISSKLKEDPASLMVAMREVPDSWIHKLRGLQYILPVCCCLMSRYVLSTVQHVIYIINDALDALGVGMVQSHNVTGKYVNRW